MLALLQGSHNRLSSPEAGNNYIAGIDIAGEAEEAYDNLLETRPRQDATVVTIAEISFPAGCSEPLIKIVEHYSWTGEKHPTQHDKLTRLLGKHWKCRKIVIDATGIGQPVASFLQSSIGSRVEPFTFTTRSKSELAFEILAAVNSGRVKMYRSDGSQEYKRFWEEAQKAKACYQAGQNLNFYVDRSDGHDDFLMSLALTVKASLGYHHRLARGS